MRSDDLPVESAEISCSNMIDVCSAFSSGQKPNLPTSFDVASYSRILQQVAKLYPYEETAITASLSLGTPSNSYRFPLFGASSPFQPLGSFSSALLQPDENSMGLNYPSFPVKDEMPTEEITPSNAEKALDLSTQRGDSGLSPYRRITLDQVKHKVVEDVWVENDKKLMWKDSRIAAFDPAQKLFMCLDCEHVGFLSRVAEHWLGSHANLRVFHCPRCPYTSAWSRCVKMHLTRHHNEQSADTTMWKGNPLLIEVTGLMQELRSKVEAKIDANNLIADKRFYCPHCPYATDRRDLYTRHENIHKDDKPFHCYICSKQFNRADHVKKHFVRMHADSEYDISKIRKSPNSGRSNGSDNNSDESKSKSSLNAIRPIGMAPNMPINDTVSSTKINIAQGTHDTVQTDSKERPSSDKSSCVGFNAAVLNLDASDHPNKSRRKGEKAFTCRYCNWSGSDNWCLKRHMNTHIKPFACVLCDYKAARAERLSTHVFKVHNKKICNKCSFLADTQAALQEHTREEHHNNPYSRRHICSACGMSFDTKANLETHLHLSHTRPQSPEDIVEITPIAMTDRYQDVAQKLPYKENLGTFAYADSDWTSNGQIKDNSHRRNSPLKCCPHCDYKLTQHEISKEHWLEHHEDVCGSCVHVFTSVYGPQVWKKVVDRIECTDNLSDPSVAFLTNRSINGHKRSSNDILSQKKSPECKLLQIDAADQDRSSKRSRKQSYPKKIVTLPLSHHADQVDEVKRKKPRHRFVLRCKLCPQKPKFHSIAQYKLHKQKRHNKRLKRSLQYKLKQKPLAKT